MGKTLTKKQHFSDGQGLLSVVPSIMGFYEERPPRHGHRTPAELAEDETLCAIHGNFCGMPATFDETGPTTDTGCTRSTEVAIVPWGGAPLTQ